MSNIAMVRSAQKKNTTKMTRQPIYPIFIERPILITMFHNTSDNSERRKTSGLLVYKIEQQG